MYSCSHVRNSTVSESVAEKYTLEYGQGSGVTSFDAAISDEKTDVDLSEQLKQRCPGYLDNVPIDEVSPPFAAWKVLAGLQSNAHTSFQVVASARSNKISKDPNTHEQIHDFGTLEKQIHLPT